MTTDRVKDHDRLIDELLEGLGGSDERESVDRLSGLAPDERLELRRLDLEVLGVMPYALDRVAAGEDFKRRVLAAARSGEATNVAAFRGPARGSGSRLMRWALPLAASLALASLGAAGFLFARLEEQKRATATLAAELDATRESVAALAGFRRTAAQMRDQLALVTQPGVEMCALRPRPGTAGKAFGILYVAPDHQHWYLSLHGLEPEPEGRSYQLWFMADGGPVSAGTFTVGGEPRVDLGSETMPSGTAGVLVTLEEGGGAERPSGPEVLYGDEVMRLL